MRTAFLVHLIAVALTAWIMTAASADEEMITGTASFRERIGLPPNAVFEAVLEDVSRVDAPAVEIARTTIEGPGQPPIAFSLAFDRSAIDERFTYAVRTRICVGERLMFTSNTLHRVLTRGAPNEVAVMMQMIGGRTGAPHATDQDVLEPPAAPALLDGMFVYMADAARLTECKTGRSYPVAMEADFQRLERAYLQARAEPGEELMVTFDGRIAERPRMEGEGSEETAVVERFINVWSGETCERNRADATLTNTYWRIVKLADEDVRGKEGHREPHILLRADPPHFSATAGCNQIVGGYETAGETLHFQQPASTMMACPPPLDQLERRLADALAKTATWRINGQVLELRDDNGKSAALLRAVYLR